jgi:asparagine synthase (glutamine-hydrolysing)
VCGIAGAFFVRHPDLSRRFAAGAAEILAHRGPDDADRLELPQGILVHRRLSILDPTAAGRQPFSSPDGSLQLIHNGEIYNYLELRSELRSRGHGFTTETDTEVMLAAYLEWGEGAVSRFNGIWAFALWDARSERLLLSRDRLGVKPMYTLDLDGGLAFASEIKALLPMLDRREPNLGALRDYAWHGLVDHADESFLRAIRPIPAATTLIVDGDGRRSVRYWRIADLSHDADPRPRPGDAAAVGVIASLLRDAVSLQLRSDVALGTCLSGGLDSSTLVAMSSSLRPEAAAHRTAPRVAVTAGFPGSVEDETTAARSVAEAADVEHVIVLPDAEGSLLVELDRLVAEQDEPFVSSSILAQRAVMAGARDAGVKVMLDGQGADELFGGYLHYWYPWLLGLSRARPTAVPQALRALRRRGVSPAAALRQAALSGLQLRPGGVAPIGRAARPPAWLGPELAAAAPLVRRDADEASIPGTPLARHLRRAVVSTSLPALLRYEDRNSMRFGIEARVPYLDHRLVEAAMRLPDRLRIHNATTKVVLREVARGSIPEPIRTDRRKIGFATPERAWIRTSLPAIRSTIASSLAVEAGYLDRVGVTQVVDRVAGLVQSGGIDDADPAWPAIWRILSVEAWLKHIT